MQITRNRLNTAAGPTEWFTGQVFVDRWPRRQASRD